MTGRDERSRVGVRRGSARALRLPLSRALPRTPALPPTPDLPRTPARPQPLALPLALAMTLALSGTVAGCQSDPAPEPPQPVPSASTPAPTDPVAIAALRPITLLPGNVSDPYGERIARLLFRGLMRYDATGKAVLEAAESIETGDDQTFTVTLKEGWSFANGEPLTSASFVNAWNYTASGTNRQYQASAFALVAGYPDVHPRTGKPAATTMRGLSVVDTRTFTISLVRATPGFRDNLGRLAFAPLSTEALKDPATAATTPIGNGPYRIAPAARTDRLDLVPSTAYQGEDKPRNTGLSFRFMTNPATAYKAIQTGELDVVDYVPLSALPTFKDEFELRAINQPVGANVSLVFPMTVAPWNTPVGATLRLAISQSIDRPTLAQGLFSGTRTAATDLAAPVVEGRGDLCGDACRYAPDKAAVIAGALRTAGVKLPALKIAYNADRDHRTWVSALCRSVARALSVTCTPVAYASQAALLTAVQSRTITTPFVTETTMVRRELGGFLTPRFLAGAAENDSRYAGSAGQSLLAKAVVASDDTEVAAFQELERQLLKELPAIPLWYANATAVSTERVEGVKLDVFGQPVYTEIGLP